MKKWQKTIISLASIFTLAACGAQEGGCRCGRLNNSDFECGKLKRQ
jgi:hypothetical protein